MFSFASINSTSFTTTYICIYLLIARIAHIPWHIIANIRQVFTPQLPRTPKELITKVTTIKAIGEVTTNFHGTRHVDNEETKGNMIDEHDDGCLVFQISAQESRRKKKEYMDGLERRVTMLTNENSSYKDRLTALEDTNRELLKELQRLQALLQLQGS